MRNNTAIVAVLRHGYEDKKLTKDYRPGSDHTDDRIAGPSAEAFAAGCAELRNRSSPSSAASAMPNSSQREVHVTATTGRAAL